MSSRRGYYFITDECYDGPFESISEAKEEVSRHIQPTSEVSIITTVTLETRNKHGSWETVH